VLARRGDLGRCSLVTEAHSGWLCGTGSALARPNQLVVSPEFLVASLSQRGVAEQLMLAWPQFLNMERATGFDPLLTFALPGSRH
jgi:hypothetical protein